jgi:hypothetical protein
MKKVNKSRKNGESKIYILLVWQVLASFSFPIPCTILCTKRRMGKKWWFFEAKINYDTIYAFVIIHKMYFKDFIHSSSARKRTWLPCTWFGFMVDKIRLLMHVWCWVGELWKNANSKDIQLIWRRKEWKRHKEYLLYLHNIPFSTWK